MKKTMMFCLLLGIGMLSASFCFAAVEANSRIAAVTVYPSSALVTRSAVLELAAGDHQIVFSNIIPEVDENSLRVSGSGAAQFKILGAQVKREYLQEEPAERVKKLQQDIEDAENERRKLIETHNIAMQEREFIGSIRLFSQEQIPKDLVTKIPATKDLSDLLGFLDKSLKDNFALAMDLDLKIRDVDRKLEMLRRELSELRSDKNKMKRSIVVDLQVVKSGHLDLNISYLVSGASWNSLYDARADFNAAKVELVAYGIVKQTTGEDWQDVAMTLSTAKPAIGGRMSYVSPWFLRPQQPPSARRWEAKTKLAEMAGRGVQSEAFSPLADESAIGGPEKETAGEVYASAEERGTAIVYVLPRKTTVKSDGSENKLAISSQGLVAKFEYSAYPRAVTQAYLGSRVTNAANLQLLAGRVNIFLDGDFVGTSSIDNVGPAEEFDLYLGVDENVKVKREQIEKKVDETLLGGILSPNIKTTFTYKITLENYKSKLALVNLFEAVPVSEDDRIKVRIDKVTLEPSVKDWKDRKGVWLWELVLQPKEKKEIFLTFTVEHPRQLPVEGL